MDSERIGKYRILSKIGAGAMGEVFRAHDEILNRPVAIKKMMVTGSSIDKEMRSRFLREAQSAALLNHPNIVTVYDFGEEDDRVYMAMELLEGESLRARIDRNALGTLEDRLRIMEQMCDGLAYAHSMGVIHRDLKPSNIHVQPRGQVKIMDFGLARLSSSEMTRRGMIMGTPNYMAPEQVRGDGTGPYSDVYSLGAVFYEMLRGQRAFDGDSVHTILYKVVYTEPEALGDVCPHVPQALRDFVERALAKDLHGRYADGNELWEALVVTRKVLSGEITLVEPRANLRPPTTPPASIARVTPTPRELLDPPTLVHGQPAPPQAPRPTPSISTPSLGWRSAALALGVVVSVSVLALWRSQGAETLRPELKTADARGRAVTPPPAMSPTLPPTATTPSPQAGAIATPLPGAGALATPAPTPALMPPTPSATPAGSLPTTAPTAQPRTPSPEPRPRRERNPSPGLPVASATTQPIVVPTPTQVPTVVPAISTPPQSAAPLESEQTAVRSVIGDFRRAVASRDLALYKKLRPSLTPAEEATLRRNFREVGPQVLDFDVQNIDVAGTQATARVVVTGSVNGEKLPSHTWTIRLVRGETGWTIVSAQ